MKAWLFWTVFVGDLGALLLVIGVIGPKRFGWLTVGLLLGVFAASLIAALSMRVLSVVPQQRWKSAFLLRGAEWGKAAALPFIIVAGGVSALLIPPFLAGVLSGAAVIVYYLVFCPGLLHLLDQYRELFEVMVSARLFKQKK